MAEGPRRWLVKAIHSILLPEFARHGFSVSPLTIEEQQSREFRASRPFGRLRRKVDTGWLIVELQMARYGTPSFRVSFGISPSGGLDHPMGHIAEEEVRVALLPRFYYLRASRFSNSWFSPSRQRWWSRKPITEANCREVAEKVVTLIPEIEQVLLHEKRSPHVSEVTIW